MSRARERREMPPVTTPRYETVETRKCDKCKKPIDVDEHEEAAAHELIVALDQEQCVSFYRRRDLCPACLDPIWLAINELLGVSGERAWDERDKDYFDEDGTVD